MWPVFFVLNATIVRVRCIVYVCARLRTPYEGAGGHRNRDVSDMLLSRRWSWNKHKQTAKRKRCVCVFAVQAVGRLGGPMSSIANRVCAQQSRRTVTHDDDNDNDDIYLGNNVKCIIDMYVCAMFIKSS